jgi:hypothetical protein
MGNRNPIQSYNARKPKTSMSSRPRTPVHLRDDGAMPGADPVHTGEERPPAEHTIRRRAAHHCRRRAAAAQQVPAPARVPAALVVPAIAERSHLPASASRHQAARALAKKKGFEQTHPDGRRVAAAACLLGLAG